MLSKVTFKFLFSLSDVNVVFVASAVMCGFILKLTGAVIADVVFMAGALVFVSEFEPLFGIGSLVDNDGS